MHPSQNFQDSSNLPNNQCQPNAKDQGQQREPRADAWSDKVKKLPSTGTKLFSITRHIKKRQASHVDPFSTNMVREDVYFQLEMTPVTAQQRSTNQLQKNSQNDPKKIISKKAADNPKDKMQKGQKKHQVTGDHVVMEPAQYSHEKQKAKSAFYDHNQADNILNNQQKYTEDHTRKFEPAAGGIIQDIQQDKKAVEQCLDPASVPDQSTRNPNISQENLQVLMNNYQQMQLLQQQELAMNMMQNQNQLELIAHINNLRNIQNQLNQPEQLQNYDASNALAEGSAIQAVNQKSILPLPEGGVLGQQDGEVKLMMPHDTHLKMAQDSVQARQTPLQNQLQKQEPADVINLTQQLNENRANIENKEQIHNDHQQAKETIMKASNNKEQVSHNQRDVGKPCGESSQAEQSNLNEQKIPEANHLGFEQNQDDKQEWKIPLFSSNNQNISVDQAENELDAANKVENVKLPNRYIKQHCKSLESFRASEFHTNVDTRVVKIGKIFVLEKDEIVFDFSKMQHNMKKNEDGVKQLMLNAGLKSRLFNNQIQDDGKCKRGLRNMKETRKNKIKFQNDLMDGRHNQPSSESDDESDHEIGDDFQEPIPILINSPIKLANQNQQVVDQDTSTVANKQKKLEGNPILAGSKRSYSKINAENNMEENAIPFKKDCAQPVTFEQTQNQQQKNVPQTNNQVPTSGKTKKQKQMASEAPFIIQKGKKCLGANKSQQNSIDPEQAKSTSVTGKQSQIDQDKSKQQPQINEPSQNQQQKSKSRKKQLMISINFTHDQEQKIKEQQKEKELQESSEALDAKEKEIANLIGVKNKLIDQKSSLESPLKQAEASETSVKNTLQEVTQNGQLQMLLQLLSKNKDFANSLKGSNIEIDKILQQQEENQNSQNNQNMRIQNNEQPAMRQHSENSQQLGTQINNINIINISNQAPVPDSQALLQANSLTGCNNSQLDLLIAQYAKTKQLVESNQAFLDERDLVKALQQRLNSLTQCSQDPLKAQQLLPSHLTNLKSLFEGPVNDQKQKILDQSQPQQQQNNIFVLQSEPQKNDTQNEKQLQDQVQLNKELPSNQQNLLNMEQDKAPALNQINKIVDPPQDQSNDKGGQIAPSLCQNVPTDRPNDLNQHQSLQLPLSQEQDLKIPQQLIKESQNLMPNDQQNNIEQMIAQNQLNFLNEMQQQIQNPQQQQQQQSCHVLDDQLYQTQLNEDVTPLPDHQYQLVNGDIQDMNISQVNPQVPKQNQISETYLLNNQACIDETQLQQNQQLQQTIAHHDGPAAYNEVTQHFQQVDNQQQQQFVDEQNNVVTNQQVPVDDQANQVNFNEQDHFINTIEGQAIPQYGLEQPKTEDVFNQQMDQSAMMMASNQPLMDQSVFIPQNLDQAAMQIQNENQVEQTMLHAQADQTTIFQLQGGIEATVMPQMINFDQSFIQMQGTENENNNNMNEHLIYEQQTVPELVTHIKTPQVEDQPYGDNGPADQCQVQFQTDSINEQNQLREADDQQHQVYQIMQMEYLPVDYQQQFTHQQGEAVEHQETMQNQDFMQQQQLLAENEGVGFVVEDQNATPDQVGVEYEQQYQQMNNMIVVMNENGGKDTEVAAQLIQIDDQELMQQYQQINIENFHSNIVIEHVGKQDQDQTPGGNDHQEQLVYELVPGPNIAQQNIVDIDGQQQQQQLFSQFVDNNYGNGNGYDDQHQHLAHLQGHQGMEFVQLDNQQDDLQALIDQHRGIVEQFQQQQQQFDGTQVQYDGTQIPQFYDTNQGMMGQGDHILNEGGLVDLNNQAQLANYGFNQQEAEVSQQALMVNGATNFVGNFHQQQMADCAQETQPQQLQQENVDEEDPQ